ncbi:conserved hypothetical protein [Ricinus communis]|uniref:Uncharacterized protein n=1 Tax=Ricinus communis TaxID=3988 RepID=B9STF0_RICCO|nr:conserved hypothetical protein [Ricinus communis]
MELIDVEQMETNKVPVSQEESTFLSNAEERLESNDMCRDFLDGWKLYKEGGISKHDLYCQLVDVFSCDHQDFLDELKKFLIYSAADPVTE